MTDPRRSGWVEAQILYNITDKKCSICKEADATERHHKDGNPYNNESENIIICCRKCHMDLDGRNQKLAEQSEMALKARYGEFITQCRICKQEVKPGKTRNGRCKTCSTYFARNGKERPYISVNGKDGRSELGSKHSHAKLTEDDVRAIRASDNSYKALGREYGVASNTIKAIKTYRTWKYVK